VKEKPPDDQRALKEDWLASALLVLRARAHAEEELTQRTFAPVVDRIFCRISSLFAPRIREVFQFRSHLAACASPTLRSNFTLIFITLYYIYVRTAG
jgi:hypothetical protein